MRLIDADKLLDILDVMIVGHKSAGDVYDVVDSMPTVDAEPVKHGHWIKSLDHYDRYMCSVCGHLTKTESDNYCPNCGAIMDGLSEEQLLYEPDQEDLEMLNMWE